MSAPLFTCSGQIGTYEIHPSYVSESKSNGMVTYIPIAKIDCVCKTGYGDKVQIFAGQLDAEWFIGAQRERFISVLLDTIAQLYK
jgi:hypothetical protein